VAAIALATLVEYLGVNLGIDELFAKDLTSAGSLHPGRFAVLTAFGFWRPLWPSFRSVVACGDPPERAAGRSVCRDRWGVPEGYMYGADALIGPESVIVALPAAVASRFSSRLIAVDPEHALARQVTDPGPGRPGHSPHLSSAVLIVPVAPGFG